MNESGMNSPTDSKDDFERFELDDKYVITGLIAEGGMGKVYLGETKLVHRPIAVKILHPELVNQPEMLLRFKIEAEIASSLNHPNIVNVFGSGVTPDGKPYLAMDYVEGESLELLLQACHKIETKLCVNIFAQLARAVEYTHEKGVIHRDLKPSNIMLPPNPDGGYLVKLLDFGIAKSTSVEDTVARELTLPGTVFGSALYMSPEQILGKTVNFHSDIYSFGCLMFHALTGKPPYESKNPVDCMQMHIKEAIPNVADYLPGDPFANDLASIVNSCLQKDQSQRFESSQHLRLAIEKVSENMDALAAASTDKEATVVQPEEPIRDSKNEILSAVSIVAIAALLSAIPFAFDLNLAKAESKLEANKSSKNKSSKAIADAASDQATKKVDDLIVQVNEAIKEKNLEEAEKLARTAYLTSLSLSPNDPKISDALFLLGKVFELRQNYSGASQAYNWAYSFNQSTYGPMAPQTIAVREQIKAMQPMLNKAESTPAPPRIETK